MAQVIPVLHIEGPTTAVPGNTDTAVPHAKRNGRDELRCCGAPPHHAPLVSKLDQTNISTVYAYVRPPTNKKENTRKGVCMYEEGQVENVYVCSWAYTPVVPVV